MVTKAKTVTVERTELFSPQFAGRRVGLPHSEDQGDEYTTGMVEFDPEGLALVTGDQAESFMRNYPRQATVGREGVKVNVEVDAPDEDEESE